MTIQSKTFLRAEKIGKCDICKVFYPLHKELVELYDGSDGLQIKMDMGCYEFLKKVL